MADDKKTHEYKAKEEVTETRSLSDYLGGNHVGLTPDIHENAEHAIRYEKLRHECAH